MDILRQKTLVEWAGSQVFHDAKALYNRGMVLEAAYDLPVVRGAVQRMNHPLKTSARILPDGTIENHCPCRDNQERGIVCAHIIAVALALVRRAADPERERQDLVEQRRAERFARYQESDYVRRVAPGTPGAVPARLRLVIDDDWPLTCRTRGIGLSCLLQYDNREVPPEQVPRAVPLAFSRRDESLLLVLEDICEGPACGRLVVGPADFSNLLELLQGHHLHRRGAATPVTVNAVRLTSYLKMDLDPENGELILTIHTELPFATPGEAPVYVVAGRKGWVYGADNMWPLEKVLPHPYHAIYAKPVYISRPAVLGFLRKELPPLARQLRLESDISIDLFTVEPAQPVFRLSLRGSPASLSAVLYAEYDGISLVAGHESALGHFAIPDPSDLMRYTVRDAETERQALRLLRGLGLPGETGDSLSPVVGSHHVLNFLARGVPPLRRRGWNVELEGRIAPFMETLDFVTPVVRVSQSPGEDWFAVDFSFEIRDGGTLSEAEVQRAIRKGESYLRARGRTVLIDADAVQTMMDVFADCSGVSGPHEGRFRMSNLYAAYVTSSLDALDGVDIEAPPAWRQAALRQNRGRAIEPVALDAPLDAVLRPYQKEGVGWLCFLEANAFCGILADEMGLGKTVQALAWLDRMRADPRTGGRVSLVVCPTSLVENWVEEAQRFVPHLKALMLTGGERHAKWDRVPAHDLVVTSYAILRRDVERFAGQEFAAVILDEAQHIKNRQTRNALAAKQLRARHRLVLTGTPVENSVADLWSIMDFLMPGYLGRHPDFRQRYEVPIAHGGPQAEAAQARLRRKLHPFLLRRLKRDVARELPPKIERVVSCSLTADQKTVYVQWVNQSRREVREMVRARGFQHCRLEVLRVLLRLRQICCHLGLLKLPGLESACPSAKLDLFFELLDEAIDGGHRLLVFSQFVSMLTIIRRQMEARDLAYCYLDGTTRDRLRIVREFNTNHAVPVFLISLKAGGTGLNLTGADMVIHFDPWWNPAVEDQATDRAYRIGQKRTVYSVKLITKGTVEEKVLALQQRKRAVIDATVSSDEQVIHTLTWEDIQGLLDL